MEHYSLRKSLAKVAIVFGIVLLLLAGAIAFNRALPESTSALNEKVAFVPETSPRTPPPTPAPITPAPSQPSSPPSVTVDSQAAANATACGSIIKNARSTSESYIQMFSDGWQSWNTTYAGDYDSPQAQESKDWNKNYIKKLYANFIAENKEMYTKFCGTGGTINDVIFQPDYEAW